MARSWPETKVGCFLQRSLGIQAQKIGMLARDIREALLATDRVFSLRWDRRYHGCRVLESKTWTVFGRFLRRYGLHLSAGLPSCNLQALLASVLEVWAESEIFSTNQFAPTDCTFLWLCPHGIPIPSLYLSLGRQAAAGQNLAEGTLYSFL